MRRALLGLVVLFGSAPQTALCDDREEIDELMTLVRSLQARVEQGNKRLSAIEKRLVDLEKEIAALREKPQARETGAGNELTLDLGGGVTMKLVQIPAGTFLMGSPGTEDGRDSDEGPQRQVTITRPFYLGIHEVTRGEFARFVADSGHKTDAEKEGWSYARQGGKWGKVNGASWRSPGFTQTDEHPVVCVSHNDAVAFCQWLGRKQGKAVRLPTEAEWEYACRAGTRTAYQWGDDPDRGRGWANGADQTAKRQFTGWTVFNWDDGFVFTAPAGRFRPNAWGLYDMHGNVWEWCADWYADSYGNLESKDPNGPRTGSLRVLRGGSWYSSPRYCRSAIRFWGTPDVRYYYFGFRVAVDLK